MAVWFSITEKGDSRSFNTRSFLQDRLVIGRARLSDICLPDMTVSTRHAEIGLKGGGYAICDLGSLNGTYVNGKKLVAHRRRTLNDGDLIEIACFDLGFSSGAIKGPGESRDASQRQAREILANILARTGSEQPPPTLAITGGPGKGARYILPDPPSKLEIGRNKQADVILEDRDVSRNHAEMVIDKDGIHLSDLKSRNGIFVEGDRVESLELVPGMEFRLGRTTICLEHPLQNSLKTIFDAPEEETSSFTFDPEKSAPSDSMKRDRVNEAADDKSKEEELQVEPVEESKPPPIGPADPLIATFDSHLGRTTANMPRPEGEPATKSDLGLIIIGGVITVAAVLALVYLFT